MLITTTCSQTILASLAIALVVSCKAESKPARVDTVGARVELSRASEGQNSYSAVAGDTLQLVSIGGTVVPQPDGGRLPCDAAHTPLRHQIVLAADSTYWETTIARSGCRDAAKASSDTAESRGRYQLFGDTLVLSPANIDDDTSFVGLLFSDSVVQVEVPTAQTARYSRHSAPPADPAEMGRVRTDTVFLTGDIDGSGKPDYVVRESRMGAVSAMKDYRMAVYLDKDAGSGHADWANRWDELEIGANQSVDTSLVITPGVTLLAIGWGAGDYTATDILIAEHGKVRPEISHGIDYGNGYFSVTREAGTAVIEASVAHLELHGKPVASALGCKEPEMAAIRLMYDLKTGHFAPERSRCVKPM